MAKQTKPRLGRGLSSLMGQPVEVRPPDGERKPPVKPETSGGAKDQIKSEHILPEGEGPGLRRIPLDSVAPSPFQPRHDVADADLESLASSIRASGVMQPVAVRDLGRHDGPRAASARYELVAGERRWRAARMAGLTHLPALVVDLTDQESAEWGLVENVQRADLTPIERASALARLGERFGLSHGAIAERVGLDRSTVTNLIRLNELEDEIKALVGHGLTAGHAKALLAIAPGEARVRMAKRAAAQAWSVRKLERQASNSESSLRKDADSPALKRRSAQIDDLERQLSDHLATRVRLKTDASGRKGKIVVDFYDPEQFEGLMKKMGVDLRS